MNIWLVNQYAVAPTMVGNSRHFQLARALVRRGHTVTLVASSFEHYGSRADRTLRSGERWRMDRHEDVDFLWLRVPPYRGNSLARIWSMARFADRVRRGVGSRGQARPDVVIGSNPHLLAAWGAQRLATRLHVPFVLEVRDVWPESLIELGGYSRGHPAMRVLAALERYLYAHAAGVISLLHEATEHIVSGGARRERIRYVPNGVDLNDAPAPAPPPEHDGFTVMYAGSHGLANALDTVLDAAKLLQAELGEDAPCFELLGDGVEKARLQHRAQNEKIASVLFHDAVPRTRVSAELARADAFVVSSQAIPLYRHGVSFNKFFDYMALARPVVSGLDAPNDPIRDAGAGLVVPPDDPRAMAEAIATVMAMPPEERWAMGLRGRAYVERHHDVANLARDYEEILSGVLRDGAGGVRRR